MFVMSLLGWVRTIWLVDGAKPQTGIKVNYVPLKSDPCDPCDRCSFNCVMLLEPLTTTVLSKQLTVAPQIIMHICDRKSPFLNSASIQVAFIYKASVTANSDKEMLTLTRRNLEQDQGETVPLMVVFPYGGGAETSWDSVGYVSDDVYVHWINFFFFFFKSNHQFGCITEAKPLKALKKDEQATFVTWKLITCSISVYRKPSKKAVFICYL